MTSHKELTAHLRDRIKAAGIRTAGVRMIDVCGDQAISVYPKAGVDARFTEAEQQTIAHIAEVNHLTFVKGMPIEVIGSNHSTGFRFYLGFAHA